MAKRMMPKAPQMPGPSAEDIAAQERLASEQAKVAAQTADDEMSARARKARMGEGESRNLVGVRSLFSGNWAGYQRGGDMGAI